MFLRLQDLDHQGSGDFSEQLVALQTHTEIAAIDFSMDELAYLSQVKAESDLDLDIDQEAYSFKFGDNYLDLNGLRLNFSGMLAMPEDDITMSLRFDSPESDFKSLISLIPALYYQDFESLEASGTFALNGQLNGRYAEQPETYPAFNINLEVNDGSFRYPSMPAGVEAVNLKMKVVNTESYLDGIAVAVDQASAKIAGNPIDLQFSLRQPMSDPAYRLALKTDLDLSSFQKVVPSEGFDYSGRLVADFETAGRVSQIENEQYEDLSARGNLKLNELKLRGDSLPYPIAVRNAELFLSPQVAELKAMDMQLGASDLQANGSLQNLMAYALTDAELMANFNLSSGYLDLNELMASDEELSTETSGAEDSSALSVVRIPTDLAFQLASSLDTVLYDDLLITQAQGNIAVKDGKLLLQGLTAQMLEGSVAIDGFYDSKPSVPEVDMDFNINAFSFAQSYQSFASIQTFAPIMKNTTGNYSMGLSFSGKLLSDMSPDLSSVSAQGFLQSSQLETAGKVLDQLANSLNNPSYQKLRINGLDLKFKLAQGKLDLEPFDFKAAGIDAQLGGSVGLDQQLDLQMNTQVPVAGVKVPQLVSQFSGSSGKLPINFKIGGTVTDPKLTASFKDLGKNLLDQAKAQASEKTEEVKEQAKEQVNAELDKLVAEAENKGDELLAAAEKQAEQIRKSASQQAQKIRDEANRRADRLVAEAGANPIKKAAAQTAARKLREEADQQATGLETEADRRATQLVDEAKQQKEKLIEDARAKAKVD
jgi:F0F1-type ATP synthase membrane subunit b/b'